MYVYIQPEQHGHHRLEAHKSLRKRHFGATVSYPIHDLMCILAKLDEEMLREDWSAYFRERQSTQASLQSLDMFIASRALNPTIPAWKRARFSTLSMCMRRLMYISPFIDINKTARRAAQRATTNIIEPSMSQTIWDIDRLSLEDKKDPDQQNTDVPQLHHLIDHIQKYTDIDITTIEMVRDIKTV